MHVEWLNNGTWHDYIGANGSFVAMKVSGATAATRYSHTDNLGLISVITGASPPILRVYWPIAVWRIFATAGEG
jgi:hypothetical protein